MHGAPREANLFAWVRFALARPTTTLKLGASSIMHAAGQAAVAALGGACVRSLAAVAVPSAGLGPLSTRVDSRSTLAALDGLAQMSPLSLAIAGAVAVLCKAIAHGVVTAAEHEAIGATTTALRARVLRGLLALTELRTPGHGDHGRHESARLAAVVAHVSDVADGVRASLGRMRHVLELLLLAVVLVLIDARLAAAALVVLAPFTLVLRVFRSRAKRLAGASLEGATRLLATCDQVTRHAELLAVHGRDRAAEAFVVDASVAAEASKTRSALVTQWTSASNEILGAIALCLAVAYGLATHRTGSLLPFMVAFFSAYRPLRALGDARPARLRAEAALERLAPYLTSGLVPRVPTNEPARVWEPVRLVITDLVLAHGTRDPISFEVRPNEIVCVVGPSGAGKTTLLRTLLGLSTPLRGTIRYGSHAIDANGLGPNERPFAWVPQEPKTLGSSLSEEAALFTDEGEAELGRAARALGFRPPAARDVLSGGERQLLALARALLSPCPVLLLDEPTSALDEATERVVLSALDRLRNTKAVIVVTHRPAPIALADRVIRLDGPTESLGAGPLRDDARTTAIGRGTTVRS